MLPRNSPDDCACHKCAIWAQEVSEKGLNWINTLPQCPCHVEEVEVFSASVSVSLGTFGISRTVSASWLEPVVGDTSID